MIHIEKCSDYTHKCGSYQTPSPDARDDGRQETIMLLYGDELGIFEKKPSATRGITLPAIDF
ncbi:MAG TPA: hypothetical protein PLA18_16880 [Deltaproteobacteria bacterium]|jgi:hypothetical protein|nr:hypothetical protein [Deltaproteobacteria bacterium]